MTSLIKPARVIISLVILVTFTYIFIDIWSDISVQISRYLIDLQFIPSMLGTFVGHVFVLGGFILIILLTLLFGRVYCSFLCPLGVIQDILIFIKRKLTRKNKRNLHKLPSLSLLRYSVLGLVILSLFIGSMSLLIWLDPYSISGRMMSYIVKPIIEFLFNTGVQGLNNLDYYGILPVDRTFRTHPAFWAVIFWMLLLTLLTFRFARVYCNSLCPVGVILGMLSKLSLYKIKIDDTMCNLCSHCSRVCKAGCIDVKKKQVDFTRCVGCQNCIQACNKHAINYGNVFHKVMPSKEVSDNGRRALLGKSLGLLSIIPASMLNNNHIGTQVIVRDEDKPKRKGITPPGSLGRPHFTEHCTACGLCISHCPTHVLQPSWTEYSIVSMFQPMMDFSVKYCLYDCNICTQVCPTGAILPLTIAEKKRVQPGRSRFIEHLCVVVTKGTLCGACSEHCPTKACDMVPYKNNLTIPKVDNDICVGCGACEHACPTYPKSIIVDENVIHLKAFLPKKKVLKPLINKGKEVIEEFPF